MSQKKLEDLKLREEKLKEGERSLIDKEIKAADDVQKLVQQRSEVLEGHLKRVGGLVSSGDDVFSYLICRMLKLSSRITRIRLGTF
jgi:hypothetical protein